MTETLIFKVSKKNNFRWVVVASLVLFSAYGYSQNYEGTIGHYRIFLEVDTDFDSNRSTGFYFYESSLQNIRLEGHHQNSELVVCERFSEEGDKRELFRLKFNGDELNGTWQNGNTILNVHLTKTSRDFEKYKLRKITFVRDSISAFGTKELVWFSEKYSKKTLFRLGNGFTKEQRAIFNSELDSMHTSYAQTFLECGWANFSIVINLVSDRYVSFSEYSDVYCGGAHPNYNTGGYNFDLRDYRVLNDLTEIYPNLDYYSLLKEKYENDSDPDSECEYFVEGNNYWEDIAWVITEEGIAITPSYPHAMTPCETAFLLTYEELGQ